MIDVPPEPPVSHEQAIEQRLVDCGLNADGFSVKYEDYLQSIEIVIGARADASLEQFDCIRATVGYEIVTFEDGEMQVAYMERGAKLARPKLMADARKRLAERGLLDGLPERTQFPNLAEYAAVLEKHCGFDAGTILRIREDMIIFQPTPNDPAQMDYEKSACLLAAMAASGTTKFGFIGNEKFRDTEDQ